MDNSDASGPYDLDREAQRIQLRAEQLVAEMDTVVAGDARVRTVVESAPRTLHIPCLRETASIDRRSVNHGAQEPIGDHRRIVIQLSGERPVATKRAILTEQVAVGRRRAGSVQHFTESVRHEELRVAYDEFTDGQR
ncbi:MAG: hypothetical protein NVS2B17_30240 [Candidatus Velthaea sp.]